MKGEKFREVIEVPAKPREWPTHYVITDGGVYEYTGQLFAKVKTAPKGVPVKGLADGVNKVIREVRGDGETAVILLESMDIIVFELIQDPFGPEIESWPGVRFSRAAEAASWKDEYEEMDLLE